MIEQGSVAFGHGFEPLEQVGQLRGVELIDFADLCLLGFIAAVMGQLVVPVVNIDEGIRPVAERDTSSTISRLQYEDRRLRYRQGLETGSP